MNVLVAVASKHGSTREIADVIANELRAAELEVEVKAADGVDGLAGYDAVVLGSAVYAGTWLPEAKRFADLYGAGLARLPVWVFSSGPLGAGNPQPHDDPQRLAALLGDAAVRDHRMFVGKLDKASLGPVERLIATVVRAPEGDFRDWDAIRAWAHEIAAALTLDVVDAPPRP